MKAQATAAAKKDDKEAAEARAAGRAPAAADAKSYSVLETGAGTEMNTVALSVFSRDKCEDKPIVVTMPEFLPPAMLLAVCGKFVEDVETNKVASGRSARQLAADTTELNAQMTKLSGSDNVWVKHLTVAEQRYRKGPCVWHYSATMKYCGPEFAMVGSIKWAMKGDRMVMATTFSAALAYYRTTVGGSAEITVTQVYQCFSNLLCSGSHFWGGKFIEMVNSPSVLLFPAVIFY